MSGRGPLGFTTREMARPWTRVSFWQVDESAGLGLAGLLTGEVSGCWPSHQEEPLAARCLATGGFWWTTQAFILHSTALRTAAKDTQAR